MHRYRFLCQSAHRFAFALLVLSPLVVCTLSGPARAGSLSVKVSEVTLGQDTVCGGQPIVVSYTLGGIGYTAGGIANVKIDVLNGATVLKSLTLTPPQPGTQLGPNTVELDPAGITPGGPYTVRVTASVTNSNITATEYQRISDPNDPLTHIYDGRGVDVNRNAGSPYLGRIYVSNGAFGDAGGRVTNEGVFILNPDLTETFPGAGAKVRNSGANGGAWAGSANSPHRLTVGPDDQVYIADWSDPHSGLFIADPNGDNVQDLLIFPFPPGGQRGSPTLGDGVVLDDQGRPVYSSMSGVYVEGTGANRKIYVADYYMEPMGSIWRFDIPAGTTQWAQPPTLVIENIGLINPDSEHDVTRDPAGNTYVVNATGTDQGYKFDPAGSQVAVLTTGANYRCIAVDAGRNRVAVGTTDGRVLLTDTAFTTATPIITGLGNNVRDVAWDAEGWLYVLNSSDSRLYVYVPPGTYTVSGGAGTASMPLTVLRSPLPGDIAPVGPSGVNLGPNGQRYGDGKVDLLDAVYNLRVYAGLANVP